MKTATKLTTILFSAVLCWPQQQQPGISIGGQFLRLGIDKKEALAKISAHRKWIPLGDSAVLVLASDTNDDTNGADGFNGMLYFQSGKVSGIAADKDWITEPAGYETSLAFYRLVDGITHGSPSQVTVYTRNVDGTNGTSKSVVMRFTNGRLIKLGMITLDPGHSNPFPQQVTVSECVGNCTDW